MKILCLDRNRPLRPRTCKEEEEEEEVVVFVGTCDVLYKMDIPGLLKVFQIFTVLSHCFLELELCECAC
jgi:hypothetical protein